jgi:ATP-binding cassette, subfamily B, bacterial MsbA
MGLNNFTWFYKKYLKPHWAKIIVIFILGLFVSAVPVASIQFIRLMLDDVFSEKNLETLKFISVMIIYLYLVSGLSRFLHFSMQRGLGELMVMHLRNDLYSHMLRLPIKSYSKHHSGTLLTRVITDAQKIPEGMMLGIDFIREPLTFLGFLITAFWASWKLTAIILIIAPIVVFVIAKIGSIIKRYTTRNLEQYGIIGKTLNETISGIRTIKSFSIEVLMRARFLNINRELYRRLFKTYRIEELSTPVVEFIGSLVTAVVIYIGGTWVISGSITQGEFMTVLIALGLSQGPVKKINSSNMKFQAALSAIGRVREIFNLPLEKIRNGSELYNFSKSIEFHNLSFKYPDDDGHALKDINIKINKGEVIALVGESGSGKTTLANLIPRFHNVEEGKITIDGHNINNLNLRSLRDNISIVSQDAFLFNETIYANIICGKRTASYNEVVEAAKSANAYDFIKNFPDGFNTMIGERGFRISGGEKQRITIARALIKGAPILILDEATSSLDSTSELEVQKALNELMKDRTTIIIAHRLSTIKNADRILVLEKGKLLQEGDHKTLIAVEGPYKTLYKKQYGELS